MLEKIISGGQTGADVSGLRAAKKCGITTGGTAPKFYLTEDGPNPLLGSLYGLVEHTSMKYPPRTFANAKEGDGTIRFAVNFETAGEKLTLKAVKQFGRPHIDVDVADPIRHQKVADWIISNNIKVLNVAGNKESTFLGIGDFVEEYLCKVIEILKSCHK